jgi:hypothetical protein
MNAWVLWPGLLTALGLGLMIGVVRERRHLPGAVKAGTRTHALVAMLGHVGWALGIWPFVALLLVLGALVIRGYQATAPADPGQTGEVALLLTLVLAALAHAQPALAAGLGVLAAVLLHAKQASQHISRVLITERELHRIGVKGALRRVNSRRERFKVGDCSAPAGVSAYFVVVDGHIIGLPARNLACFAPSLELLARPQPKRRT